MKNGTLYQVGKDSYELQLEGKKADMVTPIRDLSEIWPGSPAFTINPNKPYTPYKEYKLNPSTLYHGVNGALDCIDYFWSCGSPVYTISNRVDELVYKILGAEYSHILGNTSILVDALELGPDSKVKPIYPRALVQSSSKFMVVLAKDINIPYNGSETDAHKLTVTASDKHFHKYASDVWAYKKLILSYKNHKLFEFDCVNDLKVNHDYHITDGFKVRLGGNVYGVEEDGSETYYGGAMFEHLFLYPGLGPKEDVPYTRTYDTSLSFASSDYSKVGVRDVDDVATNKLLETLNDMKDNFGELKNYMSCPMDTPIYKTPFVNGANVVSVDISKGFGNSLYDRFGNSQDYPKSYTFPIQRGTNARKKGYRVKVFLAMGYGGYS